MNSDMHIARPEAASLRDWCRLALSILISSNPADAARLADLRLLLESDVDLRSRETMPGHLTASALLFTPEFDAILLVEHRALRRWLQPGGHLEAGEFPLDAARREVAEEAGLEHLELRPAYASDPSLPLDIDSHPIPANPLGSEPAHVHHDFMYAMVVPAGRSAVLRPQASEVDAAAWIPLDGKESDTLPSSLRRAIARLREGAK